MADLSSQFSELLSNIEPAPDRVQIIRWVVEDLRTLITESEYISTIDPRTRLIGSWARDTAINSVRDADVIVFLEGSIDNVTPAAAIGRLKRAAGGPRPGGEHS